MNATKALLIAISLFLLSSVLFAQTTSGSSSTNPQSQQQQQPGNREVLQHGKSDVERVTREARHELLMLPYYSVFDNLAYQVNPDGTLVLMGQVVNATLKSDAEARVRKIEGVETVDNRIEVLPTSPNDDRLRRALYRAIYGHEALSKYAVEAVPSIHIIVKNGQVTLDGVVMNEMDKNLANIQANGVPGVFKVTNNLRVEK
jgi:hyperosmotically inducible protein